MGSGTKKTGPGGHCRQGRAQLLEGLVASLPKWYVQKVEGQLGALLLGCEAGLSWLSPPKWTLHILSSPAKERDCWELETCIKFASP